MLQPRIRHSLCPSTSTLTSLAASLSALSLTPSHSHNHTQIRTAYHAAQGVANGPKDGAGKRLGLKASATQFVQPGTIIFRQRGTKWHPGENVGVGRDHTIYARVSGYVRYYRDPARHPKRKFIGVSLEREGKTSILPTPANAISRRRLGMYAAPRRTDGEGVGVTDALSIFEMDGSEGNEERKRSDPPPIMRAREYRISNVELARQAEKEQVKVREFDRRDRFYAWRVRTKKIAAKKIARASAGRGKKKAQKKRVVKK